MAAETNGNGNGNGNGDRTPLLNGNGDRTPLLNGNGNGDRTPLLNVEGPPSLNAVAVSQALLTPLGKTKGLVRKAPNASEEKEQGQGQEQGLVTPLGAAKSNKKENESAKRRRAFASTKNVIFEYTMRNGRPVRVETDKKTGKELRVLYMNGGVGNENGNGNGENLNTTITNDMEDVNNDRVSGIDVPVETGYSIPNNQVPLLSADGMEIVTDRQLELGQRKVSRGEPIPSSATRVFPPQGGRRKSSRKSRKGGNRKSLKGGKRKSRKSQKGSKRK